MEEKIKKFVYNELNENDNGHDYDHALRVYNNALSIYNSLDVSASKKIIVASSLLHDCVDHKLYQNVGIQIEKIKILLCDIGFTLTEYENVIDIITNMSYSKGLTTTKIEAMVVTDADRLDAIGAIGIIRTIIYGQYMKRKFYDKNGNSTIDHFNDKLFKLKDLMYTKKAKELAIKRHNFLKAFYDEYFNEIENKE